MDLRVTSRRRDGWSKWIGHVAEEEKWRFDLGEEEQMKIIETENCRKGIGRKDTKTAAVANGPCLLKEAYIATASALRAERGKYRPDWIYGGRATDSCGAYEWPG